MDDPRLKAGRIGARAELSLVQTVAVSAHIERLQQPAYLGELRPDVNVEPSYGRAGNTLLYQGKYSIRLLDDEEVVAVVNCELIAQYTLPEDFEAEDDEYEAFGNVTVALTLHPYVRETVQSMAARLGLTPTTLGVIRLALGPLAPTPTSDRRRSPRKSTALAQG